MSHETHGALGAHGETDAGGASRGTGGADSALEVHAEGAAGADGGLGAHAPGAIGRGGAAGADLVDFEDVVVGAEGESCGAGHACAVEGAAVIDLAGPVDEGVALDAGEAGEGVVVGAGGAGGHAPVLALEVLVEDQALNAGETGQSGTGIAAPRTGGS